jgi:Domain of unknown function (DUF5658)
MDVTAALVTVAVTVSTLTPAALPNEATAVAAVTIASASTAGVNVPVTDTMSLRHPVVKASQASRPAPLIPLSTSFVAMQGLDIFSTSKAVSAGAQEANPLMQPVAGKSVASIAVKAASTAGSVFFTERAWKQNRKGAVVLMTTLNIATATIVAHNTQVKKQAR